MPRPGQAALLAGMSAEYVIRLEQGRAGSPPAQVLGALARALRLSGAERSHLFALAGQPEPADGRLRGRLTPGVQRLLGRMPGTPVGVYDTAWTLLAWNRLHAALTGDPSALTRRERNLVWQHFTRPPGRVRHTPSGRPDSSSRWSPTCAPPASATRRTRPCAVSSRICAARARASPLGGTPTR